MRNVLPEDWQICTAVLAFWGVVIAASTGGSKEEPAAAVAAPSGVSTGALMNASDEGFEEWVKDPANEAKYIASYEDVRSLCCVLLLRTLLRCSTACSTAFNASHARTHPHHHAQENAWNNMK